MTPSPTAAASQERGDYLHSVCGLLWPAPAEVTFGRAGSAPAAACTELIVLPKLSAPRLLVPAGRRAGRTALRGYGEPGSAKSRLAVRALAAALGSGAGGLLRDRLFVAAPPGAETIESFLSTELGQPIQVSMHLGAARANRKPVLQLLTADGKIAGYAKIGVSDLTADLVRAERDALARLADARLPGLTIPQVRGCGTWQDLAVLVLSPLPVWQRRTGLRPGQLAAAMAALARSPGSRPGMLAASGYWQQLTGRLAGAGDGAQHDALRTALARLGERSGHTELAFGAWHGDWTPWNMASTRDGLLLWDWERFGADVPLGFDALHYWLQAQVVPGKADPEAAARECVRRAQTLLEPFGIATSAQAELTALLYLAELSVRYLADRQEQAGARLGAPGRWLIPALTAATGQP